MAVFKLVNFDLTIFTGYLRNKQLQKAYSTFCDTTRHLSVEEKDDLKSGKKPLDISIGLVSIVRDYFLFKNEINEFLSSFSDPFPPIIVQLVEEDDTLRRLKIILEYLLKENLKKVVNIPRDVIKKRKRQSVDVFDISHSNTSTPEIVHPSKRKRESLTTYLTVSANKEIKSKVVEKSSTSRREVFLSSPGSSEKEDDEEEEEDLHNRTSTSPLSQVLKTNSEVRSCCAIH